MKFGFQIRTSQVVSISELQKTISNHCKPESLHANTHSFPKGQKVEIKVPYSVFIAHKDCTVSQAVRCWPLTAEAEFDSKTFHMRLVVERDDLHFSRSTSIFPLLVHVSFN
jgi:hypothetical protein